ncbi:MAG TPA: molybdopterin dinucleotide binding domain-containing protein, partial [Candidatus Acidoferrales bacterium]|nr:molybdopterin dinucleotide binding domain-containing protein [Candidatus Acidoferrales bacterium]
RVRLTETILPETIFAAFHWGGSATINDVVGGTLDPISKMPPFKACAVKIEAIDEPSVVSTTGERFTYDGSG